MKHRVTADWIPSVILLSVPVILYFITSAVSAAQAANSLSSLNALCAGLVIGVIYWRNRGRKAALFLLASLACLSWGLADCVWAWLESEGADPGSNAVLWVLYAIPNTLLAIGLIGTVFSQVPKWNAAQMLTDQITIASLGVLFLWTTLLNENWQMIATFMALDFTSLLSLLLDFIIVFVIFQWMVSEGNSMSSRYATVFIIGCSLFVLTDLLYYNALFKDQYIVNGLIDLFYAFSIYLLGIGAIFWERGMRRVGHKAPKTAPDTVGRWIMLSLMPALYIVLQLTGQLSTPFDYAVLAAEGIILFQNWWATRYIRLSMENARLLRQAQSQNQLLESLVIRQQQKLTDAASKDSMTGLYQRQPFLDLVDVLVHQEVCQQTSCLMMVDIDRLNAINKAYGTEAGDLVIIETARRLTLWNVWGATLSRMAGEEFGIFLCGEFSNEQLLRFCREIRHRLSEPIPYTPADLPVTVSIGLAVSRDCTEDARIMAQNAEVALDQAKSLGYNQYYLLDPLTNKISRNRSRIEIMLRQSNPEKDFELHYQPQFALPGHQLIGAEALIRWRDHDHGNILPTVFIPVAEEIGMIHPIGKWVLHEAMLQSKRWNEGRAQPFKVAVNLSASQMKQEQIIDTLMHELRQTGVDPGWMDLEVTENVMLETNEFTYQIFNRIRELGLTISIDDFGSGHASFGYIGTLPFQKVKVDKVLIDHLNLSNGVYVLKSIVDMARTLGIKTIAEGVETEAQLAVLNDVGCDQVQGFLLGRPVRAGEFERLYLKPGSTIAQPFH